VGDGTTDATGVGVKDGSIEGDGNGVKEGSIEGRGVEVEEGSTDGTDVGSEDGSLEDMGREVIEGREEATTLHSVQLHSSSCVDLQELKKSRNKILNNSDKPTLPIRFLIENIEHSITIFNIF